MLEIGAFQGETTRILCNSVSERGGYVVVVDPMRWSSEIVRNGIMRHVRSSFEKVARMLERNLDLATYEPDFWRNVGFHRDNVVLHRALSTDAALLANDDARLAEFDAVFIDGDHSYHGAKLDLTNWGSRVRDGGIVMVHDAVEAFPGVVQAIEEWSGSEPVDVEWPVDSLCVLRVDRGRRSASRGASVAQALS